ncbi:MAG: DUF1552 domain-containing protein [Planctomycetes bacterium]|nr:DUF1552 domain-containing protein [Planctomycetota bacterium]
MRPFRQVALDRRTFLRGSGAALALPWLQAMTPALRPQPAPPRRAVFVFAPNGQHMPDWRPDGDGRAASLGPTMQALQPFRERLTVFSGLAIDGGRAHGDGPGDHARAASSFLTCAHPRKTGGADIHVGTSIDQVIATQVGGTSTFASLELGMEKGAQAGICDSGYSCAYSNNIAWKTPGQPVAKETDPQAVFARLFGDPQQARDAAEQERDRRRERSILDCVLADAKALAGKLAAADKQKLEEYLTAVRELELRLQKQAAATSATTRVPDGLFDRGASLPDKLALQYELIALALQADLTRVVTFMLGNGGSNRSYKFIDVPDGHHDLSHHGKKPEKQAGIAKINRFHVDAFGAFLGRLAAHKEGSGDLLDSCLIVYGSGISDGDRHNHDDLPMLLAGGHRGRGHVAMGKETPAANLYLAIGKAMGATLSSFGDSTGALEF